MQHKVQTFHFFVLRDPKTQNKIQYLENNKGQNTGVRQGGGDADALDADLPADVTDAIAKAGTAQIGIAIQV